MSERARTFYEERRRFHDGRLAHERARSRRLSGFRLAVALLFIGALGFTVWGSARELAAGGVALTALLFIVLLRIHDRVIRAERKHEAGVDYAVWGLERLSGEWKGRGNQAIVAASEHPFARDLDIEGKGSLRAFLDTTATAFGASLLEKRLTAERNPPIAEIRRWQEAVRELSEMPALREALYVHGANAKGADPTAILSWVALPPVATAPLMRALTFALPVVTLSVLALGPKFGAFWFLLPLVLQLAVARAAFPGASEFVSRLTQGERGIAPFAEMMRDIERGTFAAPQLVALQRKLSGEVYASEAIGRLARIVSFAEARENEVFRLFIAPFFLWEAHSAILLEAWRVRFGAKMNDWFAALGEFETTSALGTFLFDHDGLTFPIFEDVPIFSAKSLGHPLIAETRRVSNDVPALSSGSALIVTGSNMSGKSTMLRAIGTNIVLAYAGAPVVAATMTVGPGSVMTSMRIADSLEEGISHFLAELLRLRTILQRARDGETVFFLLDEILHGTNHRERLIGAKLLIRELIERKALGLVSTHDLGVGELETETAGLAKNVHFEEQVESGKMTFDYRMRSGLVESSNALRLMSDLGLIAIEHAAPP